MAGGNRGVGHGPGGQFGGIAQGDGMHRADMVQHLAALGEGDFGIAGTQFDELRGDAGEIGCELADHGAELSRADLLVHLHHLTHGKLRAFQD